MPAVGPGRKIRPGRIRLPQPLATGTSIACPMVSPVNKELVGRSVIPSEGVSATVLFEEHPRQDNCRTSKQDFPTSAGILEFKQIATERGSVVKRYLAALVVGVMIFPFAGSAAASDGKEKVACLFYQTFREREPTDCL